MRSEAAHTPPRSRRLPLGAKAIGGVRYALTLVALLLIGPHGESLAASETYTGLLVPDSRSPPIPVVVDLEQARSKLSGQITTSAPLTGKGRIVTGERQRSVCNFKTDIGAGRSLAFDGYCLSRTIEGTYKITFPDGSSRSGTYRLLRAEKALANRSLQSTEQPSRSATICLSLNSACLAACPRGDYNAEFICSNRCRQKLAACRAKTTAALETPAPPVSPQDH